MKHKLLYLLLLVMIILNGCTQEPNEVVEEPIAITVGAADREIIERSESISDIIVDLYGIDDATTIILNDDAIIGVKIAYDEKLSDDYRAKIEEAVKNYDNGIAKIVITDKSKLFDEINDVITDVLQGKPYENYINAINNIKNRIR